MAELLKFISQMLLAGIIGGVTALVINILWGKIR